LERHKYATGPVPEIVEDMKRLEARKVEVLTRLASADQPPPLLHPNMAAIYAERIEALHTSLQHDDARGQ
jgi:site-specific DNA recombinase